MDGAVAGRRIQRPLRTKLPVKIFDIRTGEWRETLVTQDQYDVAKATGVQIEVIDYHRKA